MTGTCFDGIQNQDETGLDCGGVCVGCSVVINDSGKTTELPPESSRPNPI